MNEDGSGADCVAAEQVATPAPVAPAWHGRTFPPILGVNFYGARHASEEWDRVFAELLALLADPREEVRRSCLYRLDDAWDAEREQTRSASGASERLRAALAAAVVAAPGAPELFDNFCGQFFRNRLARRALLPELCHLAEEHADNTPGLSGDSLMGAVTLYGGDGRRWAEAGPALLAALDDPGELVRAAAAYRVGKLSRETEREPTMRELILRKEWERPGVAAGFWNAVSFPSREEGDAWLLDALCGAPGPEPFIPYFPCNLGFDAHERFSEDPAAVRRLLDAGRVWVAAITATEENRPVQGMEPLLFEIGDREEEPEAARLAVWHLAYHYHALHPRGAAAGYAERVVVPGEIDLLLLFSTHLSNGNPYAAVIWPAAKGMGLSLADARRWVDTLFPPSLRGEPKSTEDSDRGRWYRSGYVELRRFPGDDALLLDRVDCTSIGYRSDAPWNPRVFLPR